MPLAIMETWLTHLEAASTKVLVLQALALDIIKQQPLDSDEELA